MSSRKNKRRISFKQEQQMEVFNNNKSQIVEFYKGRCVLVTGASGYLGKLIIEKLLRTCMEIRKIFVLIRPKKNKSAHERLDDLLESTIFDNLKELCIQANGTCSFEQLKSKLIVLEGNLEEPFLGQNIERLLQLADEVSVIIHSAAIVSFVGKLKLSVDINLVGTHNVLQLASKLPKLCALVHVSTCYSNCAREKVNDHIYPVDIEPMTLIELAKTVTDDTLELLRGDLIGQHPNNYTYSKQLAEYLCGQFVVGPRQLPVVICRPSIIVSTLDEPIKGFVDNRNAGNGVFDCASRGTVLVTEGKYKVTMDLIPADFVSNCVISLAWFADLYHRVRLRLDSPPLVRYPQSKTQIDNAQLDQKMVKYYLERKEAIRATVAEAGLAEELTQVPVVHVSSGVENPVAYGQMVDLIAEHACNYPSMDLFRRPGISIIENHHLYKLLARIDLNLIGPIMDCLCDPPKPLLISGGSRRISSTWSKQFERCYGLMDVLSYFFSNNFEFNPASRQKLIDDLMNNEDRHLFNCDARQLEWDSYSRDIALGTRRYLIGELDDNLPEARQKFERTLWKNTLIQVVFVVLIFSLLYKVF